MEKNFLSSEEAQDKPPSNSGWSEQPSTTFYSMDMDRFWFLKSKHNLPSSARPGGYSPVTVLTLVIKILNYNVGVCVFH